MSTILSIRDLVAGYGWGDILHGVNLDIEQGSITCVIGPNGAGKSTLLKVISGLLTPKSGDIQFEGKSIAGRNPTAILSLGVGHVPQDRSLFPLMSVWDNVLMGGYILRERSLVHRRADEVAEMFPIIKERRHERAGGLSGGQQKTVEIARSLMLNPKVVLMDEVSMGLDPRGRRLAFDTVQRLNEAGRTVLMVEQNARAGLAIAHYGAVMEAGTVKLEGSGKSLLEDPEVARLYLGKVDHLALHGGSNA